MPRLTGCALARPVMPNTAADEVEPAEMIANAASHNDKETKYFIDMPSAFNGLIGTSSRPLH